MKKTIIAVAMLFSLQGKAQMADTIAIQQMNQRIDRINLNLERAHRQYQTGTILMSIGAAINFVSLIGGVDQGGAGFMRGVGTLAMVTGGVIHIDSHKYIGRTRKR